MSNSLTATSPDEYMDMEAVENSNLVDLTGDYSSLARGLVHGRCTLGYSATIPALSTPPPTVAQFLELLRMNSEQWNVYQNSRSRGTGTFIPHMVRTHLFTLPLCLNVPHLSLDFYFYRTLLHSGRGPPVEDP